MHIHQDKDVITSSKIETHIRKCVRDEAVSNALSNSGNIKSNNAQQNAFNCIIQPELV